MTNSMPLEESYENPKSDFMKKHKNLPFIHKLVTNWLITDPNLFIEEKKSNTRNYQIQTHDDMKYLYFFGGRLRTVKQKPIIVITGSLILAAGILFWIFEARWLWHHISPSVVILFSYLWLLTMSFFIKASTSDPGVLPRNIHLPTSVKKSKIVQSPDEYFNIINLPYYKNDINGVSVKYCSTCHIWRPPRASHCGICNSCITNHDHHCVFLNNCVGFRNYRYFLWFLISIVICCTFLIVISFVHIFHYKYSSSSMINSFGQSIAKYPMSLCLAVYGCLGFIYPFLLLIFHVCLTSFNITTREYLNNVRGHKQRNYINIFDTHSIVKNIYINWLGKPRGLSLVRSTDSYEVGDFRFEKVEPLESYSV